VALLSKRQPHCRSYFISRFFGWRAVGISNPVGKEFSIPFSPASVSVQAQLPFFFFFRKAGHSLLSPQFWPVAQRSWRSPESCFFTNRLHGKGSSALCLPSSVCFCCGNNRVKLLCAEGEPFSCCSILDQAILGNPPANSPPLTVRAKSLAAPLPNNEKKCPLFVRHVRLDWRDDVNCREKACFFLTLCRINPTAFLSTGPYLPK
jgi:hypothetical protein